MQNEDSILFANPAGYHSIPKLSPDDVVSLETVTGDQELVRGGNKSNIFNRRFLFGFAALVFLGVAGHSNILRRDDSTQANLLLAASEVESKELVVVSSETTASYEDLFYADMIDSPDAEALSRCGGPFILDPPEHPGVKPQISCSPNGNTARNGMLDIIAEITTDAMGDDKILIEALKVLGFAAGVKGAVALGILFVVGKAWADMVCELDGISSTKLQIKDVERIAKYQVDSTLNNAAVNRLEAYRLDIEQYADPDFGCTMKDLQNLSRDYFLTASEALAIGIVGVQTVTNAAITSDLLLDAWKEAADSINDKLCCEMAIERIWNQRQQMKGWYSQLKRSFELYKAQTMDERTWILEPRRPWLCAAVWKGGYARQFVAYVNGNDGSSIASGWSPGKNTLDCPSNAYQMEQAKNDVRPKVKDYFTNLEKQIFYPELNAWYDNLSKEVAWKCNGEPYVPKELRESE